MYLSVALDGTDGPGEQWISIEAITDPGLGGGGGGGGTLDGALGMITAVASSTVGVGEAVIILSPTSDICSSRITVPAGEHPTSNSSALFTVDVDVLAGDKGKGFDGGL